MPVWNGAYNCLRPVWNAHFRIAAGARGVQGRDNQVDVVAQNGPLRMAKNNNRDLAAFQVLLVAHVRVRRDEYLESSSLGGCQQLPICKYCPTLDPSPL